MKIFKNFTVSQISMFTIIKKIIKIKKRYKKIGFSRDKLLIHTLFQIFSFKFFINFTFMFIYKGTLVKIFFFKKHKHVQVLSLDITHKPATKTLYSLDKRVGLCDSLYRKLFVSPYFLYKLGFNYVIINFPFISDLQISL